MSEKFSAELIAAVESAFATGQAPHETKIIRLLTAVVPIVRQECGAPDMLAALEEIMSERWSPAGRSERVSDMARAAIAKARGEVSP